MKVVFQGHAHQEEQGPYEALGLPQRKMEHESEGRSEEESRRRPPRR